GARLNARALRLAPWLEPQDASHLGWVRRLLGLHRTVRWHRRLRRAEPTLPFFRARGTAANAGRLLPAYVATAALAAVWSSKGIKGFAWDYETMVQRAAGPIGSHLDHRL